MELHTLYLGFPSFTPKGTTDKLLLVTNQVCVAMAGGWSAAMAGRRTVKDNVKVRNVQNDQIGWLNGNLWLNIPAHAMSYKLLFLLWKIRSLYVIKCEVCRSKLKNLPWITELWLT